MSRNAILRCLRATWETATGQRLHSEIEESRQREMLELRRKHREMIATVYALSRSAEEQTRIVGPPFPGEEMLADFFSSYSECRFLYMLYELLDESQISALDVLERALIAKRNSPHKEFFLDADELTRNRDWDALRELARQALQSLGIDERAVVPAVEVTRHSNAVVHRWQLRNRENFPRGRKDVF